jgi:hypothetical protein
MWCSDSLRRAERTDNQADNPTFAARYQRHAQKRKPNLLQSGPNSTASLVTSTATDKPADKPTFAARYQPHAQQRNQTCRKGAPELHQRAGPSARR